MNPTEKGRVQLTLDILRLERRLEELPWYCFKSRRNIKKEINTMKSILTILEGEK